jgi:hypothetical protein
MRSTKTVTCGDSIIGFVAVTGFDMPWTLGEFTPGPQYQRYAALFERERELNDDLMQSEADNYSRTYPTNG